MAAVEPEWILERIQPLALGIIPAVREPSPCLQQYSGAQEPIAVPPVAGTPRSAAEAEDALVVTIELLAVGYGLQPLVLLRRRLARLQPRLDHRILRERVRLIGHEVLDDREIRERIDGGGACHLGDEACAGEPVRAIQGHGAGAADALAARAAEGETGVDLAFDPDQGIEHHGAALIEVHLEGIEARVAAGFRVVAIDLEGLGPLGSRRCRPVAARIDARLAQDAKAPRQRKPPQQPEARDLAR